MRKASKTDYGYDSTFPKKLRDIMDSTKTTQAALATVCGVERQSVAQWRDGNTRPDILSLEKIARYFKVSTDYLLGIDNGKTHDTTELMDSLGLSEKTIAFFQCYKKSKYVSCINDIVQDYMEKEKENNSYDILLDNLSNFFETAKQNEELEIYCDNDGNLCFIEISENADCQVKSANQTVSLVGVRGRRHSFVDISLEYYKAQINQNLSELLRESQQLRIKQFIKAMKTHYPEALQQINAENNAEIKKIIKEAGEI